MMLSHGLLNTGLGPYGTIITIMGGAKFNQSMNACVRIRIMLYLTLLDGNKKAATRMSVLWRRRHLSRFSFIVECTRPTSRDSPALVDFQTARRDTKALRRINLRFEVGMPLPDEFYRTNTPPS